VIIDLSDRDKAERTNAYLRYVESCRGQSAQEAVRKVTIEGYQSLTNWALVESLLSNTQHIDEIHWHHHDTLPMSTPIYSRSVPMTIHCSSAQLSPVRPTLDDSLDSELVRLSFLGL
jgi:hypothetical protein